MNAGRTRREADTTPQVPQSTPSSVGYPGATHDFTLQAVIELQKSVGQLTATIDGMRASLDSTRSKVDDLVGWKNKIIGGAAVLVFVGGALGWVIAKASDYVTMKLPAGTQAVIVPGGATAQAPAAPPAAPPAQPAATK